jgi:hypothetical protein
VSKSSALIAAAIGAAATTAVDKYVIEDIGKDSYGSHNRGHHSQGFRRLADVAIGGYAGFEAYRHLRSSNETTNPHQSQYHKLRSQPDKPLTKEY